MYNIGVDIGATAIKFGIVTQNGEILFQDKIYTHVDDGFEKIASRLTAALKNIIEKSEIPLTDIQSIGLGIPGITNAKKLIHNATNLYWKNVPLCDRMSAEFPGIKILADNDANLACIAEKLYGKFKNIDNGVLLTIGTGIGSGVLLNGRIYHGNHNIGAEAGHIIIGENNFYDCSCGNNGCFETYCSTSAVAKYARKLLKDGAQSAIMQKVSQIKQVDSKLVFEYYAQGDELCRKIVARFVTYFAKGLVSLINLLDPELILIGGGFTASLPLIEKELNNKIDSGILHKGLGRAKIEKAAFGNDAGIIGAAMLDNYNKDDRPK